MKNADNDVLDNQTPVHEQEVNLCDSEEEMKHKNIKEAKEEELQKL